jgi:hypothetical protein
MCNTSQTRNSPLRIAAVVPALAFAVLAVGQRRPNNAGLHITEFST